MSIAVISRTPIVMLAYFLLLVMYMSSQVKCTILDDYVNAPDPSFSYKIIKKERGEHADIHIINMTSLTWGEGFITGHKLWWHYVRIVVPDVIKHPDVVVLVADTGTNENSVDQPGLFYQHSGLEPVRIGIVAAFMQAVPNEPLVYKNDPQRRRLDETSLLSWSMMTFLKNATDPSTLIHLPMTKACVRGMDMVTEFIKKVRGNNVSRFIVTGVSKRGWSSWLTAAVDERVIGIVPVVFDMLNLKKSLHRMWQIYGGWSFGMMEFYVDNFTSYIDTTEGLTMQSIVDPFVYKDRLTMPKLILQATGDEFTPLDNSHMYFDELPHPKYMHLTPNADHFMFGHMSTVLKTVADFTDQVVSNTPFPSMTWETEKTTNGLKLILKLNSNTTVYDVKVYHATIATKRRDFRFLVANPHDPLHGVKPQLVYWHKENAHKENEETYWTEFTSPDVGYVGFFMMVYFQGPNGRTLEYSSKAYIVPDTLPYPPCHNLECKGSLV